jgi:protein-S-isoprenylcysteine O-methyltransferase Ste14
MSAWNALLADYGASAVAFALFALLHSVGAREPCKEVIARLCGGFFLEHYWRLLYCVLSYLALYHVVSVLHWDLNRENDRWLFVYPVWAWQVLLMLHLGSVAFMYWAFVQSDYLEFWGIKQAWRGLRKLAGRTAPAPLDLFGTSRLETRGVYGVVRHPMLSAGFWFLLTSGPSLNNLVFTLFYAVYMVIGGYYEERRLVRVFGEAYLAYRSRVPAFMPRPWRWRFG